jgi:hypothetical protein
MAAGEGMRKAEKDFLRRKKKRIGWTFVDICGMGRDGVCV